MRKRKEWHVFPSLAYHHAIAVPKPTPARLAEDSDLVSVHVRLGGGSAGAELQYIFRRLGDVDNRCPVDTVGLARTLDLNVNIQEDSQEFYLKLMNRLKDGLGSNSVNPADVLYFDPSDGSASVNFTIVDAGTSFARSRTLAHLDCSQYLFRS